MADNKIREAETKISTPYLSHFTKEFSAVIGIIKTGFKPSRCDEFQIINEKTSQHSNLNQCIDTMFTPRGEDGKEFLKNEIETHKSVLMTCFCDIPHKLSAEHRAKYGNYCIALTKEWGISRGLNPIAYIAKNSKLHNELFILNIDKTISNINSQFEAVKGFVKPYIDELDGYKYYDEREWRYLPSVEPHLNVHDEYLLTFEAKDIVFIIVQSKSEKGIIKKALVERFGIDVGVCMKIHISRQE